MKLIACIFTVLLLTACTSTNLAEIITALGKDPANVCVTVTTIYGVASVARVMALNAEVSCPQGGGMVVKSLSSTVIPVTVTTTPPPSTIEIQPKTPK